MQRDQRVRDNWALIYAQEEAICKNTTLTVVFCVVPEFLGATERQYGFMLKGLREVEIELAKFNISFKLLTGNPPDEVIKFVKESGASLLVTDFNPLRIVSAWKKKVTENLQAEFHEVDAHNIVPCRIASDKLEFGAYTIRPKINRLLDEFLEPFPSLRKMKATPKPERTDWDKLNSKLKINRDVKEADWILPGEKAAAKTLKNFLDTKLKIFAALRNDPNAGAVSDLSPYLHFGQISAQRIALETLPFIESSESQKSFLEELIVRRELSDNFCHYNPAYDSFEGFPAWARESLNKHRRGKREFVYSLEQFEKGITHDDLWNAAQHEMIIKGKMHGYMRMYWAKKILEWSPSPESAMETAIYLNDKYELDGRDPNGYTGIAWSIGGVHDRAWTERTVFGKIRYMNFNGCKRKFDVAKYISRNLMNNPPALF